MVFFLGSEKGLDKQRQPVCWNHSWPQPGRRPLNQTPGLLASVKTMAVAHRSLQSDKPYRPLIAVGVDGCPGAVAQISAVTAVVPNGRPRAIIEPTPLRVILVGIDSAGLPWLNQKSGKGVNMVGDVPQRPAAELDREGIIIANFDVFIWFLAAGSVIVDVDDVHIAGRARPLGSGW